MKFNKRSICSFLAAATLVTAGVAEAAIHKVHPGESIQAALDAASSGDTVMVWPGTYEENVGGTYGLRITKDNIRLIGKSRRHRGENGMVRLLASGEVQTQSGTGVYAAPAGCEYNAGECNSPDLKDFFIRGFTVEGFGVNGIQTRFVDGFKIVRNESVNNLNNGLYPTLSANGLVRNNSSYGSLDTAMWIAGSENVRVIGNELYGSVIGFEITVSNNVVVKHNEIYDNTVGVGLFHPNGAGNPAKPVMADWIIEKNEIYNNNRVNMAVPGTMQAGLPPGAGVLLLGVSDHVVRNNRVEDNNLVGIITMGWCTANYGSPNGCETGITLKGDPSANNNLIEDNELTGNGTDPGATPLAFVAADLAYFSIPEMAYFGETSSGNCYRDNESDSVLTVFSSEPDGQLPTDGC